MAKLRDQLNPEYGHKHKKYANWGEYPKPFVEIHNGCRACGKIFRGITAFDTHRKGEYTNEHPHYGRYCEIDERFEQNEYGHWRLKVDEEKLENFIQRFADE